MCMTIVANGLYGQFVKSYNCLIQTCMRESISNQVPPTSIEERRTKQQLLTHQIRYARLLSTNIVPFLLLTLFVEYVQIRTNLKLFFN